MHHEPPEPRREKETEPPVFHCTVFVFKKKEKNYHLLEFVSFSNHFLLSQLFLYALGARGRDRSRDGFLSSMTAFPFKTKVRLLQSVR